MRILYLNHTATVSGGEMSLLDLLGALPSEVEAVLATPRGDLADRAARLGVPVLLVPAVDATFRLHPLRTPLALGGLTRAGAATRVLAGRGKYDLIHANSVRAGLIGAIVRSAGGPPLAVHVRDCLPPGRAAALTRAFLRPRIAIAIANSRYTGNNFNAGGNTEMAVVPSPVDLGRFDPASYTRATSRAALGLAPEAFVVTVAGQITPWKNQELAIRAAAAAASRVEGLRLLVVGSAKFAGTNTRYDNPAYLRRLQALASELGVTEEVSFLGERGDIPEILAAADIALVPSIEEPFGRTVIEAMAMGLPVVVTSVGGPPEVVSDGVDGYVLAPDDVAAWAERLVALARDPASAHRIGEAARHRARDFGLDNHVSGILAAYRRALPGR